MLSNVSGTVTAFFILDFPLDHLDFLLEVVQFVEDLDLRLQLVDLPQDFLGGE